MIATMESRERERVRSVRLQTMVTPVEAERIFKAAERDGLTVSDYIRACLMQDAVFSLDKGAIAQLTREITERVLAVAKLKVAR